MKQFKVLCGEQVSVRMKVTGHPQPTIKLTSHDKTTEDVHLDTEGDNYKMIIAKAEVKHEGTYRITAVNCAGEDDKEFTLKVGGKLTYFNC